MHKDQRTPNPAVIEVQRQLAQLTAARGVVGRQTQYLWELLGEIHRKQDTIRDSDWHGIEQRLQQIDQALGPNWPNVSPSTPFAAIANTRGQLALYADVDVTLHQQADQVDDCPFPVD